MPTENAAETLVLDMEAILTRLDALDAPIAAAYLDSAIEALCRESAIKRITSNPD